MRTEAAAAAAARRCSSTVSLAVLSRKLKVVGYLRYKERAAAAARAE
jgi:hypothetical protein